MRLVLQNIRAVRESWSLAAEGTFKDGIHLVTGPVGSGKSTLAFLLADLESPQKGTVTREGIGRTVLSLQFPEHHVTGFTLAEEIRSWGLEPELVLEAAGFTCRGNDDPFRLSQGELKRLHLECVLRIPSDLLILDEPFSGLDPREKAKYCAGIAKCRTQGITILLTHEQEYFPPVDRIWEIQDGKLVSLGCPEEAYSSWRLIPVLIRDLVIRGQPPCNLSREDIREALCRIRE
ncbi:MAG: ATP-binding cassette domain-containing protein [Methanoregulaceae archaeon]